MANKMRAMGTQHESAIVNWFRDHGWLWAKRKPLAGGADEGDIWLSERIPFLIEAKTARKTTDRVTIGGFLRELDIEIANAEAESGAVILKQRGTTDVGKYVVLMRVEHLQVLLRRAYQEPVLRRRRTR